MSEEFVGAGWSFPVDVDATGGIRLVRRETEIEQSIRLILSTAPGERPMRPEFGCAIHDHVFDGPTGARAGSPSLCARCCGAGRRDRRRRRSGRRQVSRTPAARRAPRRAT
jgi:hypothetical protein